MSTGDTHGRLRVVIAGAGVAGLETALALKDLADDFTSRTLIAHDEHFVMRPQTVREPFSYPKADRWPLAPIARDAGAELVVDELEWVDPAKRVAHTRGGEQIEYDALVIAMGARATPRYKHSITVDPATMDETMHGLVQDVEGGYVDQVVFLAPARMAWPMPLYELALMTAGRAYDMDVEVAITIATPEDRPLALFGSAASDAVSELLDRAGIEVISSAYAEVPRSGEVIINPGDRHVLADRVVALPELYGPAVRGLPLSEHGFFRVDKFQQVLETDGVYAAGDATEFAVKHGGISSQMADVVAEQIAAAAGADITPEPFQPVVHGMLLTDDKPLYLTARITGGQGFSSEVSDTPTWSPPTKIASRYLTPYLDQHSPSATEAS
jgi:sulfide:quinone oxidoreductase